MPRKPTAEGVKVWVIVVSVLMTFILVGLMVLIAVWMKRRLDLVPRFGYKKQDDDMSPLESAAEL